MSSRAVGHQIAHREPADLNAVAPHAGELPAVDSGRSVENGDVGVEDVTVVVIGRSHPVDLLLCGRNDLIVARQSDEAIVSREQERDAVLGKQGGGVVLPSSAGGERVEVLAEPPTHIVAIHDLTLSRWRR